jgi:hypothetical protein
MRGLPQWDDSPGIATCDLVCALCPEEIRLGDRVHTRPVGGGGWSYAHVTCVPASDVRGVR